MFAWLTQLDADAHSAIWIVAVGAMTNVACALVGCYLVLRRMSLLGDALSHAVLPGLVAAFVLAGSMNVVYMFAGAMLVGLLTTLLTQVIHRQGGVPADASMGVVFTGLFALGVVLIKRYGQGVHIDVECVLHGEIQFVTLHEVTLLGMRVPRTAATIAPVLAANLLFIAALWKELKITSFDAELATSLGIRAGVVHYALMAMVALTTVASFEAVGSILVVAMLIVPGAAAHLLTDRLRSMLWIAAGIAAAAAVLGYAGAVYLDVNVAGMMAVTVGGLYLLAVFLAPRHGVAGKLWRKAQIASRIVREDLLAMLYRLEESESARSLAPDEARRAVGGGPLARFGLLSLLQRGDVAVRLGVLELCESGRRRAASLVRSHRLWEAYLVQHLGLKLDHVHDPAERMEHFIDDRLKEELAATLADAQTDPHGRQIPRPGERAAT